MDKWIKDTCSFGDFYTNSEGVNIQAYGKDKRWPELSSKIDNNEVEVIDVQDTDGFQDWVESAARSVIIGEIEAIEAGLMRSTIGLMQGENSADRAVFDAGVAKISDLRTQLNP